MKDKYTIGEFSKICGLSIKALQLYHEKGILIPSHVDESSGYRLYDETKTDKARVIMHLREMEISIEDMTEIFRYCDDDSDVFGYLQKQKQDLQERLSTERYIVKVLNQIIEHEKTARHLLERANFSVKEKTVDPMLVAGIRIKGKYSDCDKGFERLGRTVRGYIKGRKLCLYYDGEYREEDAEFEPCFPVRKQLEVDGVSVRQLPESRCVTLVHKGRYDTVGRSYAHVLRYVQEKKITIALPTREIYIKGPGTIFCGNPNDYLTEIQLPIAI
ncbi:MAG TPA: MerR family transcriptional regulator [Candidatus Binatia bacterium]|nr:MerR family transcriptional regulator [Candidatus Binatia bacterium]